MSDLKRDAIAMTDAAGYAKLPIRTLVRVTGKDRQKFLHSFCTADIKALSPGNLAEAFVLNDKGKILSHVTVLALEEQLLLAGSGLQAATLLEHLEKYVIREDVLLTDRSDEYANYFVCGRKSGERLGQLFSLLPDSDHVAESVFGDTNVVIANTEVAGRGFLFIIASARESQLVSIFQQLDIPACHQDSLEFVRIKNRTPQFGTDMDISNLPQELNRDSKAISFNKGCYLGQETVARIDAIGHVNQLLVGLQISSPAAPAVGVELLSEAKTVGKVTSVAQRESNSNGDSNFIGLGYVRRAKSKPGTVLEFVGGTATVLEQL